MQHQDPAVVAEVLASGRPVRVEVAGSSMSPTLVEGDSVMVWKRRARTGDVVLIRGTPMVLHRLVGELRLGGRGWVVHRGDAAAALPGLCRPGDLLGVADVPRRLPSLARRVADTARAVVAAAWDRVRRR